MVRFHLIPLHSHNLSFVWICVCVHVWERDMREFPVHCCRHTNHSRVNPAMHDGIMTLFPPPWPRAVSVCFMCCLREMFAYTNSAYRGNLSCVLARMPISIATQSQRKRERGFEQTSRLLHHPCHSIATMSIWSRPLKTLINWKWVLQGHDGRRFSAQIVKIIWLNDQSQQVSLC